MTDAYRARQALPPRLKAAACPRLRCLLRCTTCDASREPPPLAAAGHLEVSEPLPRQSGPPAQDLGSLAGDLALPGPAGTNSIEGLAHQGGHAGGQAQAPLPGEDSEGAMKTASLPPLRHPAGGCRPIHIPAHPPAHPPAGWRFADAAACRPLALALIPTLTPPLPRCCCCCCCSRTPSIMKGRGPKGGATLAIGSSSFTLQPSSLALTFSATLAQYWERPRAGKPMPAFLATTHCEGTPSMESEACLTSRYSCWPAGAAGGR